MKLEQPRINSGANLEARVDYLERYIFRLVGELQMALNQHGQNTDKGGTK